MSAAAVFILLIPLVFRLRKNLIPVLIASVLLLRVLKGGNGDGVFTGENTVYRMREIIDRLNTPNG